MSFFAHLGPAATPSTQATPALILSGSSTQNATTGPASLPQNWFPTMQVAPFRAQPTPQPIKVNQEFGVRFSAFQKQLITITNFGPKKVDIAAWHIDFDVGQASRSSWYTFPTLAEIGSGCSATLFANEWADMANVWGKTLYLKTGRGEIVDYITMNAKARFRDQLSIDTRDGCVVIANLSQRETDLSGLKLQALNYIDEKSFIFPPDTKVAAQTAMTVWAKPTLFAPVQSQCLQWCEYDVLIPPRDCVALFAPNGECLAVSSENFDASMKTEKVKTAFQAIARKAKPLSAKESDLIRKIGEDQAVSKQFEMDAAALLLKKKTDYTCLKCDAVRASACPGCGVFLFCAKCATQLGNAAKCSFCGRVGKVVQVFLP